ncbi:MAG TPA: hypothetical protein VJ725_07300 [Thermoanaerobaculia bacterium]|nr:hypothetical protein [Thermoanaerobaculia bacterium]
MQKKSDASILEDSRTGPKEKSVKASHPSYMDRVYQFSLALGGETLHLHDLDWSTPKFNSKEAAHQQVLAAAVGMIGVHLGADGVDREAAIELASQIFDAQVEHGFMRLSAEPRHNEFLTTAFGEFWDAGMAAILYVVHARRKEMPGLFQKAAQWWLTYLDMLGRHLSASAWESDARITLTPCLRGATAEEPQKAVCRDRDEIYAFVYNGRRTEAGNERERTGLRIFCSMENIPLFEAGAGRLAAPYTYPVHERAGGSILHAHLPEAHGLQAQWMVGANLKKKPEGAIDIPGGWAVVASGPAAKTGGKCPVAPPEGA